MKYKISGEIAQAIALGFEPNETAWASNSSLMSYTPNLKWDLRIPGGLGGALKRSFAGEGVALTYLEAQGSGQIAHLTSNQPGHLMEWSLEEDGEVITTRGSFLCAWGSDIDINVSMARRTGAMLFGGAGLFLQKIKGSGTVIIHGSGDFIDRRLRDGEQLMVSTGNLAAFSAQVDYDIRAVGSFSKAVFGGEGLFMTHLTGPGRVLLQTLKRTLIQTTAASG